MITNTATNRRFLTPEDKLTIRSVREDEGELAHVLSSIIRRVAEQAWADGYANGLAVDREYGATRGVANPYSEE